MQEWVDEEAYVGPSRPLLEALSPDERHVLFREGRRRKFERNEVIFHEGDVADSVHLVDRGRVAVRTSTSLGDTATLAVLGPGEIFGELGLLTASGRRTASAVALEATETLRIDRHAFERLRRHHPSIDRLIMRTLAEKVGALTELLMDALFVPVDTRVIRRLLSLTRLYGDGGRGVVIPLTQQDLAELAGTSRATVNRVLGEMEETGAVAVSRRRIKILDAQTLARRAL